MDYPTREKEPSCPLAQMLFLSQIVSAQLCHDIASPMGALLAGVEMLPPAVLSEDQEIIDLLQSASRILKNRLDMSRAAFASGGKAMGSKQAKTLIFEYFDLLEKIKLTLDWPLDPIFVPKGSFQLLIHLLMWMALKAPKGGEMRISLTPSKMDVCLTAPAIFIRADDEALLKGEVPLEKLQPQTVQTYLIYLLATVWNTPLEIQKFSAKKLHFFIRLDSPPGTAGYL